MDFDVRGVRARAGMSNIDIVLGFLAGMVSCLTPEAFLLIPLLPAATGADNRAGLIAIAIGLGLSVGLTGMLAASVGFDSKWLRWIICALLLLQGITLMSVSLVERFPKLTGGLTSGYSTTGASAFGGVFRLMFLGIFVGANWVPLPGPTMVKASLMAADAQNSVVALGVLFVFGAGAAVPWIVVGRVVRLLLRPVAASELGGMAGKRILGATLLIVAIMGITGLDATLAHWLEPLLPVWTRKLAITF
jgi:cytochrome c-type biogenesis protein